MPQIARAELVAFLRSRILRRLAISDEALDDDMVLADLGLKSLDAVLISGEIEDRFEIEVDPVMMFEHRTINAVVDHLLPMIGAS